MWRQDAAAALRPLLGGQFYSTPAVAYGRVYLGNTDGHVYSLAAANGKLAWRKATSGYVYASPAVAEVARHGPTVYVGSYDGHVLRARRPLGQSQLVAQGRRPISGSATIVGNIVYFANLASRSTVGLAVRSGSVLFRFPKGGFTPVISDGEKIYLTGYSSLYGLIPKTAAQRAAARRRVREARAHERKHRRLKRAKKARARRAKRNRS